MMPRAAAGAAWATGSNTDSPGRTLGCMAAAAAVVASFATAIEVVVVAAVSDVTV